MYDYSVPEKISNAVVPGVRVQLPFGNRETEGIIVERVSHPERAGSLKAITKVLSPHVVATPALLHLVDKASNFYCCNPWDLLRSAIPPRVAAVDKELPVAHHETWAPQSKKPTVYQSFKPFLSSHEQLSDIVRDFKKLGSVLIVAPDERDVDKIIETLSLTFTMS